LAYFRTTHKEIRILKNKFALLTKPGDFTGTVYKKPEWAIIYLPRKNNLKLGMFGRCLFDIFSLGINSFRNLEKILFSAYKENTLNGEKKY
jgi:hypothetical protein